MTKERQLRFLPYTNAPSLWQNTCWKPPEDGTICLGSWFLGISWWAKHGTQITGQSSRKTNQVAEKWEPGTRRWPLKIIPVTHFNPPSPIAPQNVFTYWAKCIKIQTYGTHQIQTIILASPTDMVTKIQIKKIPCEFTGQELLLLL